MKLNVKLVGLEGDELKDGTGKALEAYKIVANFLYQDPKSPDPLRSRVLAEKVYKGTDELDKADCEFIKERIEDMKKQGSVSLSAGVHSQIIEALSKEV